MNDPDVVPLPRKPPDPGVLEKRIRELVRDGAFSYGTHVFDRPELRDVELLDALEILSGGAIEPESIRPGDAVGEWVCKMAGKPDAASRRLAVVCVVIRDQHLFMTTVEWEHG